MPGPGVEGATWDDHPLALVGVRGKSLGDALALGAAHIGPAGLDRG